MQASHQYKASTQATPHHHQTDPAFDAGYAFGQVVGPVLVLGVVVLWAFMVYRGIRWFFRATR